MNMRLRSDIKKAHLPLAPILFGGLMLASSAALAAAAPPGFTLLPGYSYDGTNCYDDLDPMTPLPDSVCLIPDPGPGPGPGPGPAPSGGGSTPVSAAPTANTLQSKTVVTSLLSSIVNNLIKVTSSTSKGTSSTTGTGKGKCKEKHSTDHCNVAPATISLSSDGLFLQTAYTVKKLTNDGSALDTRQEIRSFAATAGFTQDFDQWGYSLSIPLSRTTNNGDYSALDSTSLGVQFAPQYHFLVAQVHGVSLDIGAQLGYNRIWYDDLSAVRSSSGRFAIANYSNLSTANYGLGVDAGMPVTQTTRISAHVGAAEYINLENRSLVGDKVQVFDWELGVSQQVAPRFGLTASVGKTRILLGDFNQSYSYGMMQLGGTYLIDQRSSLSFDLGRSFSDGFMSTVRGMISFNYDLN